MKKNAKIRILLITLLMAAMFIAGCGKSDSKDSSVSDGKKETKGRYVEKVLKSPAGYSGEGSGNILNDGSLCVVDTNKQTVNISKDNGEHWNSKTSKIMKQLMKKKQTEIYASAVDKEGGYFFCYVDWAESNPKCAFPAQYYYVDKNGKEKKLNFKIEKGNAEVYNATLTSDKKLILMTNMNKVYSVDIKTFEVKLLMDCEEAELLSVSACDKDVIINTEKKMYYYDMEKGEQKEEDKVLNHFIENNSEETVPVVLGGCNDKKIYAAYSGGIYVHSMGGKVMEQLVEGCLTSMGEPSKEVKNFMVQKDGSLVVFYKDGEIALYQYDSEALTTPKEKLTIYSLYDNKTVRQAIAEYRRKNPDVYINLEVGMSGEGSMTEGDAIKNLNTEILAGKGPDVMMLDGIPYESYIEKGILMDLGKVVKDIKSDAAYYDNILETYQDKDSIYTIPIRFYVPALMGEQEKLSQITDISSLAKTVESIDKSTGKDATAYGGLSKEYLLYNLYPVYQNTFLNKDGNLNQDKLEEFYAAVSQINKAEHTNKNDYSKYDNSLDDVKGMKVMDTRPMFIIRNTQKLSGGMCKNMYDLKSIYSVMRKDKNQKYKLYNNGQSNPFIISGLAGICANTKSKELAAGFVKTMLSTEVQKKDLGDGYPVNKTAFASYSKKPAKESDEWLGFSSKDGAEITLVLGWPEKEEIADFEKNIEILQSPVVYNSLIQNEIITTGVDILKGKKEIKDGTQEVSKKIALLHEE